MFHRRTIEASVSKNFCGGAKGVVNFSCADTEEYQEITALEAVLGCINASDVAQAAINCIFKESPMEVESLRSSYLSGPGVQTLFAYVDAVTICEDLFWSQGHRPVCGKGLLSCSVSGSLVFHES